VRVGAFRRVAVTRLCLSACVSSWSRVVLLACPSNISGRRGRSSGPIGVVVVVVVVLVSVRTRESL
jgi:hypothetical protein